MKWLHEITDRIAAEHDLDASALRLSADDVRGLLDVTKVAAHTSGRRINAPLLSYILGVASAQGVPLSKLIATATAAAETAEPDSPEGESA